MTFADVMLKRPSLPLAAALLTCWPLQAVVAQDRNVPGLVAGSQPHPAPKARTYLEKRYGLTKAEAARRIALERDVTTLASQLAEAHPNEFITSIIDQQPVYRVTLVFSTDVSPSDLRVQIPPDLRSALKISRSKYTRAEIDEKRTRIRSALVSLGVNFSLSFVYRTEKFVVSVDPDEAKVTPSGFPDDLRADLQIRKIGAPSQFQTGVQPGDPVYGGWDFYDQNNTIQCTYGFVVRDSSGRQGITTAAHCPLTSKILISGTRYVTLPAPFVNERSSTTTGRSYDFRAHLTTGMTTGPWVWYWNDRKGSYSYYLGSAGYDTRPWANGHPNYDIRGQYFHVVGAVTGAASNNISHVIGAVRCKNGVTTGLTCGEIYSNYTDVSSTDRYGNNVYYGGYVEVGIDSVYADHMVIAFGGDSGGPAFTEPQWNPASQQYEIYAAGSLVGGNTQPTGLRRRPCVTTEDPYCYFVYMPVDRLNDRVPVNIVTSTGSVAP